MYELIEMVKYANFWTYPCRGFLGPVLKIDAEQLLGCRRQKKQRPCPRWKLMCVIVKLVAAM
jgi:hypothetical protein